MNLKKHLKLICIIAGFIVLSGIVFLFIGNNSVSVYYRTYTKENGWSSWKKNGAECGTNSNITAVQIKEKSLIRGTIYYNAVSGKKSELLDDKKNGETLGNKKEILSSINVNFSEKLFKKYKISYKTYSKELGWSKWVSDGVHAIQTDDSTQEIYPIKKIMIKASKR